MLSYASGPGGGAIWSPREGTVLPGVPLASTPTSPVSSGLWGGLGPVGKECASLGRLQAPLDLLAGLQFLGGIHPPGPPGSRLGSGNATPGSSSVGLGCSAVPSVLGAACFQHLLLDYSEERKLAHATAFPRPR